MSKVILLEPLKRAFDLSDLDKYGELVVLYPDGRVPSFFNQAAFTVKLALRLREISFNPDKDHLVILGRSTYILVTALLLLNEFGVLNFLIFDAPYERYSPFTIRRSDERSLSGDKKAVRAGNLEVPANQETGRNTVA